MDQHKRGAVVGALFYIYLNLMFSKYKWVWEGEQTILLSSSRKKNLIHFSLFKNFHHLQFFGDSQIICNWINKTAHCNTYTLQYILDETHRLISHFDVFSCRHIYRERNSADDSLSKEASLRDDTNWLIEEERDGIIYKYYHRPFIELGT